MSSLTHPPRSIKRGNSHKHVRKNYHPKPELHFTNWILLTYIFTVGIIPLLYYHFKAISFKHKLRKIKKIPYKPLNALIWLLIIPLVTSFIVVIYYGVRANNYYNQLLLHYSKKQKRH